MSDQPSDAAAWDAFCDPLRGAGHTVLAAAPDYPFDRAEGLRYVTRLARRFLNSTIEKSDPRAAILSSTTPKIGLTTPTTSIAAQDSPVRLSIS